MKKMRLISGMAVSAIIVLVLIFNSCSKQEDLMQNTETTATMKDYTIYNKISSFTEKMDYYKNNNMYKSGESIEVDSALWLMEGAMNLTYGFPFEEYGEFTTGTDLLTISKNSVGEIDMDEVAVKYEELIEKARVLYYSSGYEEKGLMVLNMEKQAEDDNEVIFGIETVTGNKNNDPWPFGQGENWWYGELGGGCEGNTQTGSDAAHELAKKYPTLYFNECIAIAGPKTVGVKGGESWLRRPNDPMDNQYDYYIFCVKDNVEPFVLEDDLCLLANEMSTYYYYLDYVISDLAPEQFNVPYNHVFIDITDKYGNFEYFPDEEYTQYYHFFELLFGLPFDKPNCDPPIEL